MHGGQIHVSSIIGKGTTFEIVFEQKHIYAVKPNHENIVLEEIKDIEPSFIKQGYRILIVEDNPDLLNVLNEILSKYYHVTMAFNGREALNLVAEQLPDLILSDILMPVMDGFELCNEIKRNPSTFHIPVVLLTAIESQEASIQGFNSGADAYLTKPFNENVLITRIVNLINSREKLKKYYPNAFFSADFLKNKEKNAADFIEKCKNYIIQNSEDENFGMETLASLMNISASSLHRKIKDIAGMKVVDFIKKIKMEYAAQLLLYTNTPVNEISWKVGYADPKYFSKCFQKEFSYSPTKYRNKVTE